MKHYNKKLDELFDRWLQVSDKEKFCRDGLMLKYGQKPEYVDEQWEKAPRRVMFLVKDNPDGWGHDTRTWLVEGEQAENSRKLKGGDVGKSGFLPNIAKMLYGLLIISPDNPAALPQTEEGMNKVREIQLGELSLLKSFIAICSKYGYKYLAQATENKIRAEFGKEVNTDKADRHFDFAIDTGSKLYLMEVNYYGNGGSKLKSVAGEFGNLFGLVKNKRTGFIWITDGEGWLTAKHPLREAFEHIDYIMNINMLEQGLLEEILVKGL